uniref:GCR093 n=1 Tax=Schmidtea mediterranea TaxID=79327 RepID=A0A193KUK1_SCHMD|nr:GCR093 [Schmidtea mediterranea]
MCEELNGLKIFNKYYIIVYPPILIFFGVTNNVMILILMSSKIRSMKSRQDHMPVYYLALSIGDALASVFLLLPKWLKNAFKLDPFSVSEVSCRILPKFIPFTISDFCIWLVVVMTIDVFIRIYFPIQFKILVKIKRVYFTIFSLVLLALLKNCWYVFENSISDSVCSFNNRSFVATYFSTYPSFIVSMVLVSILPVTAIVCLNVLIFLKWRKLYPKIKSTNSFDQVNETQQNTIKIFLVISVTFSIYVTPNFLLLPFSNFNFKECSKFIYIFIFRITESIFYLNHITNFYFYILLSKSYRNELMNRLKFLKNNVISNSR